MAKSSDLQKDDLYKLRHSAAHVMAQAVMEMFPGEARIAIGPPIENGFYYDFDLPRSLTPEDLEAIEKRMRQIIGGKHPFHYRQVSAEEAKALYADQPYKIELIDGLDQRRIRRVRQPARRGAGHQHVQARHVRGPLPRAARRTHGQNTT